MSILAEIYSDPRSAFLYEVLENGCSWLSHASLKTGFEIEELERARDYLLERKLIRPRKDTLHRTPEFVCYEPNL